ncbi:uncharacterized protein N7506_003914 [Penicillium brevicompactum]|uniref:uncharacterized protein n=1 Tax=Penicillium brevicompactum TaxID=5074 RepID=UPI002541341E|nr:uncharacterized protein N7506_003914 [Penicillium brevicompactum]KAJ5335892.1 hypothetical protein N7506_003914 [Penicillium brevicompactum]
MGCWQSDIHYRDNFTTSAENINIKHDVNDFIHVNHFDFNHFDFNHINLDHFDVHIVNFNFVFNLVDYCLNLHLNWLNNNYQLIHNHEYCNRNKAKARRIAARELLLSSTTTAASSPPTTAKGISTPDLKMDRSSMMFTNNPSTEYFPSAQSIPLVSNHHSHTPSTSSQATTEQGSSRENMTRANTDDQTARFV